MRNQNFQTAGQADSLRQSLDTIKRKYPNTIITQSYLRCEKLISNGITGVKFDILTNEGSPNSTERRLAITDRFVGTSWALYIQKATTSAAADRAKGALKSWNNPNVFSGTEATELQMVYSGYLRAIIDKDVIIDAFDCDRFYRVPDSQKGTLLYTTAPAGGTIQGDSWYDTHFAFAKLTPFLVLNGAGQNEITINLPESMNAAGQSSTANYFVLKIRGMLCQNASSLNGR
jgi:hypothetical protein